MFVLFASLFLMGGIAIVAIPCLLLCLFAVVEASRPRIIIVEPEPKTRSGAFALIFLIIVLLAVFFFWG